MDNLQFAKKSLKGPAEKRKRCSGQMRPRWTCMKKVWRPKGTALAAKHSSSSVKHGGGGVVAGACMAAVGTGTFIFIDDGTADGRCTINFELNRNIWSAQVPVNTSKLPGRRFILQQDNDPKHPAKAAAEFVKAKKLSNGQVSHLIQIQVNMPSICWRRNLKRKDLKTSRSYSRALAEQHQRRSSAPGDVIHRQVQSVITRNRYATKY